MFYRKKALLYISLIFTGLSIALLMDRWLQTRHPLTSRIESPYKQKDQIALIELAKEAKQKGGVTEKEAKTLESWAKEYGVLFERRNGGGKDASVFINVGPIHEIPIR